jgi:hypothetical protein
MTVNNEFVDFKKILELASIIVVEKMGTEERY